MAGVSTAATRAWVRLFPLDFVLSPKRSVGLLVADAWANGSGGCRSGDARVNLTLRFE